MTETSAFALRSVVERSWGCPPAVAGHVANLAKLAHLPARALLVRTGKAEGCIVLLADGRARSLVYSVDGRLVMVEEFGPGDLFGDMVALVQASEADAGEVVAITQVDVGQFATPVFLSLMEQHVSVAMAVVRSMTRRLAEANRRVVRIASISAPGRVHEELLRLGRESGNWTIEPAPVLSDLALFLQTTRETVSRAVSQLEKRGIVVREGTTLRIVAPHRLEELAY